MILFTNTIIYNNVVVVVYMLRRVEKSGEGEQERKEKVEKC